MKPKYNRSLARVPQRKIDDLCELYIKYRGNDLTKLEGEMRERGWTGFSRRVLYPEERRSVHGWIERLRLPDLLEPEDRKAVIRRYATNGLKMWLRLASPEYTWDWRYQNAIYKRLHAVKDGKCRRLMIFLPPRHGKSELVTIRFTTWLLMLDPTLRVIIGSYNQKLANRFCRRIKRLYLSMKANEEASPVAESSEPVNGEPAPLPVVANPLNTLDEWETTEGGGVKAVGAGAGVTGFGADLIILDDPIKGRSAAESKNNRERVWEWFTDDLHTRLEPKGSIILIQTRWHEDDLAGRLIKDAQNGGEQWDVISFPALAECDGSEDTPVLMSLASRRRGEAAQSSGLEDKSVLAPIVAARRRGEAAQGSGLEDKSVLAPIVDELGRSPGEALCPARFSREELLAKRERMGTYSFDALYQQRPVPRTGGLFKREWFSRVVDVAPQGLRWYRGYDLAVSTKTSADYTASFRCALDRKTGDLYIADGFRKRIEFPEQRRYIVDRIRTERNTEHGIESAIHGQAFVQELWREERLSRAAFRGVRVTTDKLTRALAWANRAEAGKVVLVRGPWINEFLDEVCAFPNARHDDQVDAVSLAVQMMDARKSVLYAF